MSGLTLKLVGVVKYEGGNYFSTVVVGKGRYMKAIDLSLSPAWDYGAGEPVFISAEDFIKPNCYLYKNRIVEVFHNNTVSESELLLRIKHFVLKQEKELSRIEKEVQAFQNLTQVVNARREQIPESIRLFVWQRDQGKCAKCGSNEKLEFDHIIPIIKGGSNTERNIQLLCESCNRSKGTSIG